MHGCLCEETEPEKAFTKTKEIKDGAFTEWIYDWRL